MREIWPSSGSFCHKNRYAVVSLLLAVLLSGCSAANASESKDAKTLLAIAKVFNDNYGRNNDGPVYDRFDARSQALITRADYIHRHATCATAPQTPVHVEHAVAVAGGAWSVQYEVDGLQFVDYWFYVNGQWRFDLVRSNPASVKLYRLSYATYVSQLGCKGGR